MDFSSPDACNHNCCKHLDAKYHPSGRHMQDTKSLSFRWSHFILIVAITHALPARAQTAASTAVTTFGTGTALGSSIQGTTSPIPANSPFLGGMPTGKATADTLQLPLRNAIDRGLRYNLGLVLSG